MDLIHLMDKPIDAQWIRGYLCGYNMGSKQENRLPDSVLWDDAKLMEWWRSQYDKAIADGTMHRAVIRNY